MLHEVAAFLKRHEDELRSEIAKIETKLSQGATTTPADLQGLKAAADTVASAHATVSEAAGPAPVEDEAAEAPGADAAEGESEAGEPDAGDETVTAKSEAEAASSAAGAEESAKA
jgi:hypothetical protein